MPMQSDDENKFAHVPLMTINRRSHQNEQQGHQPNDDFGGCSKL